jgi:hypothetical protein
VVGAEKALACVEHLLLQLLGPVQLTLVGEGCGQDVHGRKGVGMVVPPDTLGGGQSYF